MPDGRTGSHEKSRNFPARTCAASCRSGICQKASADGVQRRGLRYKEGPSPTTHYRTTGAFYFMLRTRTSVPRVSFMRSTSFATFVSPVWYG